MWNLAADVLQVVSPRAADGDTFVQRERTGLEELCGGLSDTSGRVRAQPAILYYRRWDEGQIDAEIVFS